MSIDEATLRPRVEAVLPRAHQDLEDLIRIESVSSLPEKADEVRRSAEKVASLLIELGCPDVKVVAEGGHPAVIAQLPGAGRPADDLPVLAP